MRFRTRASALLITTSALSLLGTGAAFAQTAAADEASAVEQVVVTGSRLQATGFTAPTPVTVMSAQALAQRAPGAILDSLNELPAFRNSSSTTSGARGAGGVGQNSINLRGLGGSRTLNLIDGRRITGYRAGGTVDSNVIPVALVDRVEVVTGGASAAYGSDAIAGVVNFILKKHIDGVEADYHYGQSKYGDNVEHSLNVGAGLNLMDDKLQIVAGADYLKNKGIGTFYDRPWGKTEPGVLGLPATRAAGLPANLLTSNVEYATFTPGSLITAGPLKGTAFDKSGQPYAFTYGNLIGGSVMTGSTANYGNQVQDLQLTKVPIERLASMGRATYDVTPNAQLYGELGYAFLAAHSRTFTLTQSSIIRVDNPYLPAATRAAMVAANQQTITIGREYEELGGIRSEPIQQSYRGVAGAKGKFFGDWTWDTSWQHGETRFHYRPYGQVLSANLNAALYAVKDASGNIVCGPAATNPNLTAAQAPNVKAGCVPFNPFGQGAPSAAALSYVGGNYLDYSVDHRKMDSFQASFTGQPFQLPAGPLDVAFGAEYRKETFNARSSVESQLRLFNVGNQPSFSGELSVKEAFAEIGVPVIKDVPFFKNLDLNAAVRETNYSVSGQVTTWKAGLSWDIDDNFRIRATKSRDILAPDISQLYSPGAGGTCPSCRGVNGAIGFVTTQGGGNPNLTPEIGDAFTGGLVFQPKWAWTTGFRASLDYYLIKISNVIGSVAVQDTIDRCLQQKLQQYCALITFDATTPAGISTVKNTSLNLNKLIAEGMDFEASYRVPVSHWDVPGSLNVRVLGSHADRLATLETLTSGAIRITDQAGVREPEWRWTISGDYAINALTIGTQVRLQSQLMYDSTLVGPDQAGYSPTLPNSINDNVFPKVMYLTLNGAYDLKDVRFTKSMQIYGVIDNVLGQEPPVAYTFVGAGSGNGGYDVVGRTYRIGVRAKF